MSRSDVVRRLGAPQTQYESRKALASAFPEYPMSEREVGRCVLCYRGFRRSPSPHALALFYIDEKNYVEMVLMLEPNDADRRPR